MSTVYYANEHLKRKASETGTGLAFVPGQNFVYELNDTAAHILDEFTKAMSIRELKDKLKSEFHVEDEDSFNEEVDGILNRFVEHNILLGKE